MFAESVLDFPLKNSSIFFFKTTLCCIMFVCSMMDDLI